MKHWMMVSGDGRIPWFEGPFRDVDEVTGRAKTFRKLAGRNHDLHCVTLDDRGDLSADTIEGDEEDD